MRTIDRDPALYGRRSGTPLATRVILYAIAATALALLVFGLKHFSAFWR